MKQSDLIRGYGDTDFVTGLRFIAISMVVVIHTGAFVDFGSVGQSVTDNGKFGVQMFFVIAGFTIYQNVQSLDYKSYLIRRILRVVPVYYVFILLGFALLWFGIIPPNYWMQTSRAEIDLYNLVMHLSLLSSWDSSIAASIIGVEWTIPVEVFWYILLPLIVRPTDGIAKIAFIVILLAMLSYAGRVLFGPDYLNLGSRFLPLKYGLYFYLGYLSGAVRHKLFLKDPACGFICFICVVSYMALMFNYQQGNGVFFGLLTAMLIIFARPKSWVSGFLTLKPLLIIGSVSYSIYLIHMLIVYFLNEHFIVEAVPNWAFFIIVYFITFALSVFSYRFIEVPFNLMGRRLAAYPK